MTSVKIICDSVNSYGVRLTTFQLEYPRMIHSELLTHRVFSRNSSSSRAIPIDKIIQRVKDNPAMPVYWGLNQKGMQAKEEASLELVQQGKEVWLAALNAVLPFVEKLKELGFHKQIVNRALECWSYISTVLTATEFNNFFKLRCHPDAQPEIRVLAEQMRDLYFDNKTKCNVVNINQWHLPYISDLEKSKYSNDILIKASVARCARVSYLTHDKQNPDINKDVELHDRLVADKHLSPTEHIATPEGIDFIGNFRGWRQYRKTIPNESGL